MNTYTLHQATVYSYTSLQSCVCVKVRKRLVAEADLCVRGHRYMTAGFVVVPRARSPTLDAADHSADHNANQQAAFKITVQAQFLKHFFQIKNEMIRQKVVSRSLIFNPSKCVHNFTE